MMKHNSVQGSSCFTKRDTTDSLVVKSTIKVHRDIPRVVGICFLLETELNLAQTLQEYITERFGMRGSVFILYACVVETLVRAFV